jgi:hypothetical protein
MYNTINKLTNGMHYMMVNPSVIKKFAGQKRVTCTINEVSFHCALMPKKEGGHFIYLGAPLMKKLKLKKGMTVKPSFKKDDSTYKFEMPEEFEEVLQSEPDAFTVFKSLTEGNQRSLIYLASMPKSVDKKIERALLISKKLKHGITAARLMLKK